MSNGFLKFNPSFLNGFRKFSGFQEFQKSNLNEKSSSTINRDNSNPFFSYHKHFPIIVSHWLDCKAFDE